MRDFIKNMCAGIVDGNTKRQNAAYSPIISRTWFRATLLLGFLTIVLSGCFAGRLLSVKEQMCDFDDYVHVDIGRQLKVHLQEPVLLEKDVYMMMGVSPTTRVETTDRVAASFVFELLQHGSGNTTVPTGEEIQLDLVFVRYNKHLRLAQLGMNEIPIDLLADRIPDQAEMEAIATQACEFSISPFSRSVSMDIDLEMLQDLPGRQAIIDWFGSPIETQDSGNTIAYEYRLKGATSDQQSGRIRASFDDSGDKPLMVEASFTHYLANIDLVEGKMHLKLVF